MLFISIVLTLLYINIIIDALIFQQVNNLNYKNNTNETECFLY